MGQLFSRLKSGLVRFAVLRNFENLPHSVGSRDIDIVVMPEDLTAAKRAVSDLASDLNLLFSTYYRDERLTQFFLTQRAKTGEILDLKIDFFTNSQIYGIEAFSAAQMMDEQRDHNGLPIVNEKKVFTDKWLFHLFVGQPLHPKYDHEFAAICQRQTADLVKELAPLLGETLAREQIAAVAAGTASKNPVLPRALRLRLLRRMLTKNGLKGIVHFARFMAFRLRDQISPKGIFLSVSGPDGSGKTTVIDEVIKDLKTVYGEDSVVYNHFRPTVLPRIADAAKSAGAIKKVDKDYANPHRSKPSGFGGSLARLGYYGFDYVLGYFRTVRPILLSRRISLFDRYYYDMICDPGRSRINLPKGLLRFVGRFLPLPEYAFFIHVSPEEVHRRKQELTLKRIKELNAQYLDLVQKGVLIEVSNEGDPKVAVAQIVDTIIKSRDAKARRALRSWVK